MTAPLTLRKIEAGLYEHVPTGRLIVKVERIETGPRGGEGQVWQHARWDTANPGTFVLDGVGSWATLRTAADDLERSAEA